MTSENTIKNPQRRETKKRRGTSGGAARGRRGRGSKPRVTSHRRGTSSIRSSGRGQRVGSGPIISNSNSSSSTHTNMPQSAPQARTRKGQQAQSRQFWQKWDEERRKGKDEANEDAL
eukprot:CAMPEP_0117444158 /NCGR_PEP_ID=MMETSP0759-20121206/5086_1 /TAXON_ID=63605 /ORGANISM="Percolomonas cosmopolitus, Strain WS" /LENGTH=116 /DNA_ID=CAMNT_0005236195 /DNA_START=250 /DNA_END=600 /DNA_ORIENTATION=+